MKITQEERYKSEATSGLEEPFQHKSSNKKRIRRENLFAVFPSLLPFFACFSFTSSFDCVSSSPVRKTRQETLHEKGGT